MDAELARQELYEVMNQPREFEVNAERALAIGKRYLDVDNAHLTEIHADSDYWEAVVSTDPIDGEFPPGLVLDLGSTYCRRVIADGGTVALHDAPAQGWADDPVFDAHELHCYHGSPIVVDGEIHGTVCFVSEGARSRPFSDEETLFAELIARMLEHGLQRQRTADEIERLDRFASVLAHDLRNPLGVAQGYVDLFRKTGDDQHLTTAADALDRMDVLVSDILTMVRQGETVESAEAVDLDSVAEHCWQSVVTGESDLRADAGLTVRAAPDRLRRLFENLFRNSVEHGSTGSRAEPGDAVEHGGDGVTVRVGALADDAGFYVEDDGPGIPASERDSVFERGYSSEAEGSGLGLAIVASVAAAHDWRISVTDAPAGGTRFEIEDVVVLDTVAN
ncbi:GAF domain-containing sensor histidine kinase [Halorubrum sp. AD140]|uniref:sensor histidine kinase n=1 Tax=Halorubrum sp. AD140 TaxID=3050073 RepID=UPI002ACD07DF|nr:GAF domain-containing sensor histidine kinase [Halorubrum sp. AD140]MDZ5810019.1 GAF domain-containing sensor histidine kinase [Halorubrum sp. AD140]